MNPRTLINRAEARANQTFQEFGDNLADRNALMLNEFNHFYRSFGSAPSRVILNNEPHIEANLEPINASDATLDFTQPDVYFISYVLDGPDEISTITEEFSFTARDIHRLRGSHKGDINHKVVPTHEDILDQATETINMLKAAAMDAELNPEIASTIRDYYMELRKVEPGNYPFVFDDLRPHSERPINSGTYYQLCNLIEKIQQELGIPKKGDDYASAQAGPDSPVVDIYYETGPKELKLVDVDLTFNEHQIKFSLRNDAGTVEIPWQVAGDRHGQYGPIIRPELSAILSEEDVFSLINGIRELYKEKLFVKKRAMRRY